MNRVVLDFRVDLAEVAELAALDPSSVPAGVIGYSYLRLPVEFAIARQSVLSTVQVATRTWAVDDDGVAREIPASTVAVATRLPVLFFADVLLAGLERLGREGHAVVTVPDGDSIALTLHRNDIAVKCEGGEIVHVDLADLRAAVVAFRSKLSLLLAEHVPQLRSHPGFGAWYSNGANAS